MSKEKKKKKDEEVEESYAPKYKSGPVTSKTGAGNVYNITIQIGQPPAPPKPPGGGH